MILILCSPGHVATAVADALSNLDEPARLGDPASDLFTQATGCRAIVYAPEPRVLEVSSARHDAKRLSEVLRAARAPGVERVLVIEPASFRVGPARFPGDEDGKCTVIRCAPLLDELADVTNLHTVGAVWLRRGREVELTSRAALTRSIHAALLWRELRGARMQVPAHTIEIAEAMRRAAAIVGAAVSIRTTSPRVTHAVRKLYAWLGRAALDVEAVCDRLVQEPRPVPQRVAWSSLSRP